MVNLDRQEVEIVRELIRNPRISDNQIAKRSGVPVMTVNRKRKKLEESGMLHYNAYLRVGDEGLGLFHARQLYILKFRSGITTKDFIDDYVSNKRQRAINTEFIIESHIGEKDGHLAVVLVAEAKTETDLLEDFNGILIPSFKKKFGDDCIDEITTVKINLPTRTHHNYMPHVNMEKGRIQEDWPSEHIFVNKTNHTSE